MEPFIKISNLEKVYPNGVKAVYNFNLDINKNEFIVFVGPSGCGKSTTLRMIAGLEDITKGELYLDGVYSNYKPSKDRNVAIVFQSYALYSQMNVFENIAFPLTVNQYSYPVIDKKLVAYRDILKILTSISAESIKLALTEASDRRNTNVEPEVYLAKKLDMTYLGAKKLLSYDLLKSENVSQRIEELKTLIEKNVSDRLSEIATEGKSVNENSEYVDENGQTLYELRKLTKYEIQDRVFQAAEMLDLGSYLNRKPKELSGGQMQRVALGRAIVKHAPIFLLDEPLSNLDARLRATMRAEIVRLHKRINTTSIYVTHDQTEAMTMADRIVVMSKGFIQQIDTPKEIYENPCNLFVAKFVGTPSINILDGIFDGTEIKVCDDFKIALPKEKRESIKKFYSDTYEEFKRNLDGYDSDENAKEFILHVMSAMDANAIMNREINKVGKFKKFIQWIKKLFQKKNVEPQIDYEKVALEEKTATLESYRNGNNPLTIGLRPEHVHIEIYDEKKHGKCYTVKPTLVERLGSELHVHFDFANREMIAKISASEKIDNDTLLALNISVDDVFIFDPVSGRRII